MILRAIRIPFKSGRFAVILNEEDASELGVREGDRVRIRGGRSNLIATVQLTKEIVQQGYAGLTYLVSRELGIEDGTEVELHPVQKPKSVEFIKKKTRGGK